MHALTLRGVHKSFGGIHALKGISLNVEKGETVAIIGPSGCGKTTLLKCINLLETLDKGSIYLNGEEVIVNNNGVRPLIKVDVNWYRTRVGMVFQHLNLWPHMVVLRNVIEGPIVIKKIPKSQATELAKDILAKMDIADKMDEYPYALSGGQQQRVALARALVMEPEILLLDEITSALDPELVGEILEIIKEFAVSGMTLLIVTHEMLFASEVADRVVFLDEGTIVEEGNPSELFNNPTTDRLKAFLERLTKHRVWTRGVG